MARSRFDPFNSFLRRYHKLVIVAWIIAVIVAGSQISVFFSHVSYNVAGSNFGGPTTSESQVTQDIINSQFPRSVNSSDNGIIVVVQNPQVYSSSVQSAVLGFNRTIAADPVLSKNFTGVSSVYTTEYSFLASVVPSLVAKVSQLNSSVYAMASLPITAQQSCDLASQLVANGSASSFSGSPLFKVNAARLTSLLSSLSAGTSAPQVRAAIIGVVVNDSYSEYPLVLSRSLTSNFVSADNSTMIVVYNFKASPSADMIADFRTDIASSAIPAAGTYYVTGGAVLTQDISKVFGPVLGV